MAGCWALTAVILMQKFPDSVKLTCPENKCHIMMRLENWKHEDLGNQGYIYSLESNQGLGSNLTETANYTCRNPYTVFPQPMKY